MTERFLDSLIDVIELPGVGPKKAKKLWQDLGVETVDASKRPRRPAASRHWLDSVRRAEQKILAGIEQFRLHGAASSCWRPIYGADRCSST